MASAPRAVWKGYLKLGTVSCGVKVVGAATEAGRIHFRILNRKDKLLGGYRGFVGLGGLE
jgi:DNA end-binding protein Ku